jgi:hypothetical protein
MLAIPYASLGTFCVAIYLRTATCSVARIMAESPSSMELGWVGTYLGSYIVHQETPRAYRTIETFTTTYNTGVEVSWSVCFKAIFFSKTH